VIAKELAAEIRAALVKQNITDECVCCVFHSGSEDKFSIAEVDSDGDTVSIYYDCDFIDGLNTAEVLAILDIYEGQSVRVIDGLTMEYEDNKICVDDCLGTSIDINISWGEE